MMPGDTDAEREAIRDFLSDYFLSVDDGTLLLRTSDEVTDEEKTEIRELLELVRDNFSSSKGTLGLALDFIMVAQVLSRYDGRLEEYEPGIDRDDIFDRFDRRNTASTLTFLHPDGNIGIRTVHNDVIDLFRGELARTNFPSSPGHHTGEWERYVPMLERSFRLSNSGRLEAARQIFEFGLEELETNTVLRREPPFPNPFRDILDNYPRSHSEEEGGSAFQALSYGFVESEWPHLSLRASKVRTGSSRQNRYGDIDGYRGPDLMISVEVKDLAIDSSNVHSQLDSMMELARKSTAISIAICKSVTEDARDTLEGEDVKVLSEADLRERLETWDYHKQNKAIQGMIHFFSHIEENPSGTQRLLTYVAKVDPENPALVHLYDS